MRVFVKAPGDEVIDEFDASDFIESQGGTVTLLFRADPGITVDGELDTETSIVTMRATGGTSGRLYRFGVDIVGPTGMRKVVNSVLRVRDMTAWDEVPIVETIGGSQEFLYLVNAAGELLLNEAGEAIYVNG
jgi:hypothetical protein